MTRTLLVLTTLGLLTAAGAETLPLGERGTVLPYGESRELRFTPPGEWRSARLIWAVRLDAPTPSGSTHALGLALNGQGVTGAYGRTQPRLINKPLRGMMTGTTVLPWVRGHDWRVAYAPDFGMADVPAAGDAPPATVSPYRFVVDVTDLVRRGAENVLKLDHRGAALGLRRYFPEGTTLDLVFDELAVELSDDPPAGTPVAPEAFSADRLMEQPPATADAAQAVALGPEGGLTVTLPGLTVEVVSRYAWQGGGFNPLGRDAEAQAQPGWRVETGGGAQERTATGTATEYRVDRTVRWRGDHIEVADELTNTTDQDIGLAFDHRLRAAPDETVEVYLGGTPDATVTELRGYENQSVFVRGRRSGVGFLALDDVFRIQGIPFWNEHGGIRSDTFCLPARGSYTVRWALYPVQRDDYYDFINLARRDLEANTPVPGGFEFGLPGLAAMDDEAIRKRLDERGLRYVSSGVWMEPGAEVPCYHGTHMLQAASLQAKLREACTRLRRAVPEARSLIYIHTFINTDPAAPEQYADSRVIDTAGNHFESKSYTQSIGIPFLYYYPAEDNRYLAGMKQVIDMCLDRDRIGADGVYWDEVEMMSTSRTYDRWDGHSAELDEQHRIRRKFADVHLASLRAKVLLTEYVRAKGGELIGNSAPRTATLQQLGFPRFVETAAPWYPARAHLSTPIALGDHLTVKSYADLLADIRLKLMWGGLYYYYSRPAQPGPTITRYMFPFTPVELHRGWLLGRERILTAVPGTFTFGDDAPVTVHWFGADGLEKAGAATERVENGRRLVRLPLGEGEMAAIVRRPE